MAGTQERQRRETQGRGCADRGVGELEDGGKYYLRGNGIGRCRPLRMPMAVTAYGTIPAADNPSAVSVLNLFRI